MEEKEQEFCFFSREFQEPLDRETILWMTEEADRHLCQFAVDQGLLEPGDWHNGARYREAWEHYLHLPAGIIDNPKSFNASEAGKLLEYWTQWFLAGGCEDLAIGRCIYNVLVREDTVPVEFDGDFDFEEFTVCYMDLWAYLQLCILFRRREIIQKNGTSDELSDQLLIKDVFTRDLVPPVPYLDQFYTGYNFLLYWLTSARIEN
jgi:hypothetical protein